MNIKLKLLKLYFPSFLKGRKLLELFKITSDAFECEIPETKGLKFNQLLTKYAVHTKEEAEIVIRNGRSIDEVKNRLYKNALSLGEKIKTEFGIKSIDEAFEMVKIIYDLIKIDFENNSDGEILIKRCFFSSYYTDEICSLISSLDEGILVGLTGGRDFRFFQRITEGKDCCKAKINLNGE